MAKFYDKTINSNVPPTDGWALWLDPKDGALKAKLNNEWKTISGGGAGGGSSIVSLNATFDASSEREEGEPLVIELTEESKQKIKNFKEGDVAILSVVVTDGGVPSGAKYTFISTSVQQAPDVLVIMFSCVDFELLSSTGGSFSANIMYYENTIAGAMIQTPLGGTKLNDTIDYSTPSDNSSEEALSQKGGYNLYEKTNTFIGVIVNGTGKLKLCKGSTYTDVNSFDTICYTTEEGNVPRGLKYDVKTIKLLWGEAQTVQEYVYCGHKVYTIPGEDYSLLDKMEMYFQRGQEFKTLTIDKNLNLSWS